MQKSEIEELFYKQKNYSKIKELLQNSNQSWSFNLLGKIYLEEGDTKNAYKLFQKTGNVEICAYTKFLNNELNEAYIILLLLKDNSPFSNWLLALISILLDKKEYLPTYFQIRNFYEQDLEMLFKVKQYSLIKRLLKKNEYFEKFNKEIYKYSARVLFNNNYILQAEKLIKKSISLCYKDPETHYMLGELYIKKKDYKNAKNEFKKALEVFGYYMPAEKKLKELQY